MGRDEGVHSGFRVRYGPWALVAGASEGLGAAFADGIATRGVDVVLVARREGLLREVAAGIEARHGVRTRVLAMDLGRPDAAEAIASALADLELGLLVYNAAVSPIGPFLDVSAAEHDRVLAVNCRTASGLVRALVPAMVARRRGGVVLVSSMAGLQGTPLVAHYAATKAYLTTLAEGLWDELRGQGVDVLACCAGATRTPAYEASLPVGGGPGGGLVLEPATVVAETLTYLGRGPRRIPGRMNRVAAFVMERLLTRRAAVRFMGRTTRRLYRKR